MWRRCMSSRVDDGEAVTSSRVFWRGGTAVVCDPAAGIKSCSSFSTGPDDNTTARSMMFCNSRNVAGP